MFKTIQHTLASVALIKQIAVGLVIGILIAVCFPAAIPVVKIFGDLFVKALKGVAPVLVFFLVMNAMAQRKENGNGSMKPIIGLYVMATFFASLVGVCMSFLFPTTLHLQVAADTKLAPPSGIIQVLHNLILSVVDNPVNALLSANYIGILAWAIIIGIAMKNIASGTTKGWLDDVAKTITKVVTWVIHFAPLGIMGLVADSVGTAGVEALIGYVQLLAVLIGSYFLVALVMNPIIVFSRIHMNPYPLILTTIRESGVYAFFTRSSAANIPVNMALCEKLGLDKEMYSVSIPLGATINMDGAAITITIMTLAAANTLGIPVTLPAAVVLSAMSALGACGASGVAGGSLLLIPMACSLFGISNDVAMQMVGVGFIIGVIQDSVETALNSAGDVEFAATAEYHQWLKQGKPLPAFLRR